MSDAAEPTTEATDTEATDRKHSSGSPTRTYIVLEQHAFEDTGGTYYEEVHKVDARNGQNALRKAYRELRGSEETTTTLVVIPEKQWQPTVVRGERRDAITVSIGEPSAEPVAA